MLSLLLVPILSTVTATTLYSEIDIQSVVDSISQYSTLGAWSTDDYNTVWNTLSKDIPYNPSVSCTSVAPSNNSACTLRQYNTTAISNALKSCNFITVDSMVVPPNNTLDLSKTLPNTVIEFKGNTTWQFVAADYNMLKFGGTNLTVQGTSGSVIDGNGAAWWDGQGSNGGIAKPDHMITIGNTAGYAIFKNLYIKNAPTHVFSISNSTNLYMAGLVIDMKDGMKTLFGNGTEAGHNTDGYDVSTTTYSILTNNVVFNEDDCVAITSGQYVNVSNYYCDGSHGLSIGSVGGKSNNTVADIHFRDSVIVNAQNGVRIKTNSNTNGTITRVSYENIEVRNISIYGLDIQQDYLNGGPTGIPTPGVNITDITMRNIWGTVQPTAYNYYILVATPSTNASTWTFENLNIHGGNASCDSVPSGFTCQSSLGS